MGIPLSVFVFIVLNVNIFRSRHFLKTSIYEVHLQI